ncbi:MAG: efflux RND transporter periplasmic adaptor subunit [Deltaproteobacteria bacterium]|nr:efflux RND transporter periplasmic adaptor subunit [Deltaproteobacteria bacterium]
MCPICHSERGGRPARVISDDDAPADGTKVNLQSRAAIEMAGIQTALASKVERTPRIDALVHIQYDATKRALVSIPTAGVVRKLEVDVGTLVKRGALLVVMDSVGIGADRSVLLAAVARLRAAEANLSRERSLVEQGVSPQRDVERAQSQRDGARAQVQGAKASLGAVGAAEKGAGTYTIHAPISGVVTRRLASLGQTLSAGDLAFEVVDASSMWADLEIPERALVKVRAGQEVKIHIDALGEPPIAGSISFVATEVDPRTLTAIARVSLSNPDGLLRANMFGRATVTVGVAKEFVVVPVASVQKAEGQAFVFVNNGEKSFEARRVKVGVINDDTALIEEGLKAGERIATIGAFFLKTEILKGAIGAGCCE